MAASQEFELWLEFENWIPQSGDDPTDEFANVLVQLGDGRRYGINVWTFKFLERARFPFPYQKGIGHPSEYILGPDLFVERLDRPTLERVMKELIAKNELRAEWLCPVDDGDE